jgi:diguanylate cyclase (GGDEF)-like protein
VANRSAGPGKTLPGVLSIVTAGDGAWRPFFAWLALGLLALTLSTASAAEPPSKLVVTQSASHTPFSYVGEDGTPQGILIDLWRLFGEKNGVEIEFRLVDWHESLELIRRGEVDVHGGLTRSQTRADFLTFGDEILRIRTLLFGPAGAGELDLAELADEPIGVVEASYEQEFLETHFPRLDLVGFANSEDMIGAAVGGEIQAFVSDNPTGYYRLLIADAIDRFRASATLYTESIHPAVRRGADALAAFVDAGMEKLSDQEKQAIIERWLLPPAPRPEWVLPVLLTGLISLVLVFVGSNYWTLRRLVRIRTRELNEKLEELAAAKTHAEFLAGTDALTGIGSRRAFFDKAADEIQRARRYGRPLCLVLFDLDNFKLVNDRYGHPAGDSVMRRFVATVQADLRESDFFARLGGDEFAALLPETPHDRAIRMAMRMLDSLSGHAFEYEGTEIDISFSAGVAQYQNDDSIDAWIQRADQHLYQGKLSGRGRVVGE